MRSCTHGGVVRRTSNAFVAGSVIAVLAASGMVGAPAATAAECATTVASIVAHQDDDLIFMNPDIVSDIGAGACTLTVYLTAGDAGRDNAYVASREAGARAAYTQMYGLSPTAAWTPSVHTFAGHDVTVFASPGAWSTEVMLRLPDGGSDGEGYPATGRTSLEALWTGAASTLSAVDGSATYTRAQLLEAITAIIAWKQPSSVRIQSAQTTGYDHPDHRAAGEIARAALAGFAGTVTAYRGYNIADEPANVGGAALDAKLAALRSYGAFDSMFCGVVCPDGEAMEWARRQYVAPLNDPSPSPTPTPTPSPTPPPTPTPSPVGVVGPAPYGGANVARNAFVSASSQASGQGPTKAIDAVVDGYPRDGYAEWSSAWQGAGAWLSLWWPSAQVIDRVYLFDRPNGDDRVLGGTLTFSDGSTVVVPALADDGSATVVTFPARSTTTLLFTVTSVSGSTRNIGLSELEAYNGEP